jgi:DNA-binding transcriptional ArsR family regulator
MLSLEVIENPAAAAVALDPVRTRLLAELAEPASASALAARLGLPRQRLNYHLRILESHGLVRPVRERRWGGLTERVLEATASSYVVSPAALSKDACEPGRSIDHLSAGYLVALAARLVREVGDLLRRADEAGKRLATLALDTEICFRSAADRAAFTDELTRAVTGLVARYHDPSTPGSRCHRLVVAAHPTPGRSSRKEPS